MISVEELTTAAISYSSGQLDFDQAQAIARQALREAVAAMDVVAFDRVRILCAGMDVTNGGGGKDGKSQEYQTIG